MIDVESGYRPVFSTRAASSAGGEIARIMSLSGVTDVITLSGGFPDPVTFDGAALTESFARVGAEPASLQYAPTQGVPGFRQWIADRLERLQGTRPSDQGLMVTSGGIEGLELISKVLLDPGDAAIVEAPTYLGAIMAFQGYESTVLTVPADEDGLDVDALAALLDGGTAKLLYTIPDHQNPAGISMSTERRHALVALARRHGLLILEDVAYRELGFDGDARPSLWSLAPDVVAQLGTFSKTFTPGFRMGWVAGPEALVAKLVLAKQNSDQCTGALGQRLLEDYGRTGLLDRQIERAQALYARRCGLLLEALDKHLPDGFSWTIPHGGFFTWVDAPRGLDLVELYDRAIAAGVAYVPGVPFYPDGRRGRSQMRLSFSRVADTDIPEGVRRLGAVFTEALEAR